MEGGPSQLVLDVDIGILEFCQHLRIVEAHSMVARDHRSDKFGSPVLIKFIPLAALLAPECAVGNYHRVAVGIVAQVPEPFQLLLLGNNSN